MAADSFIHHVGVSASDFEASRTFYRTCLGALGIVIGFETDTAAEFWHPDRDTPSVSLERAGSNADVTRGMHIAFAAKSRAEVDEFHAAAVAAGGTSRHAPRFWAEYRAYCAFVNDPDGNNVEATHKAAQ